MRSFDLGKEKMEGPVGTYARRYEDGAEVLGIDGLWISLFSERHGEVVMYCHRQRGSELFPVFRLLLEPLEGYHYDRSNRR